jgi:diadenosine tetraphosphate (Ap4A) HIT family hydrolase
VDDCAICQKHEGAGPLKGELIGRSPRFWVWHGPPDEDGLTRLGHLIIESDRHTPYLADLDADDSAELGSLRTRLARALREALQVDFVFAGVIGTGVAHFHEHLLARPHREPPDVVWFDSDELLERADENAVRDLGERLKPALEER